MFMCSYGHINYDCLNRFDEDGHYNVCIDCGREVEEVEKCDSCFEYVPEYQIDHGMCTKCRIELVRKFHDMVIKTFSAEEISVLNELITENLEDDSVIERIA